MHSDKPSIPLGILRMAFAGVIATAAAIEWGGAGPGKLVVGLLVFVVSYGLLRSWPRLKG